MRKFVCFMCCVFIGVMATACTTEKLKTEKLQDIDFTVLAEEDVPKEFLQEIEQREKKPFKMTFEDQGYLYIAEGYGKQATSGYSIEVAELYESENAIYVQTNLIGPDENEEIVMRPTYPLIVVKIESIDKNVVFR